jgi:nicotinamidase-related amidase
MKLILIVIDIQQDFFRDGPLAERRAQLSLKINDLVDSARVKNIPIVWVRQEYEPDLSDAPLHNRRNNKSVTIKGTDGCKILAELHHADKDYEIIKKRFSAFFMTNLDKILKQLDVDTIIITGVNTMTCVRVSAIDAYQRDYNVILALECVDAYDKEQHENSIKYLQYAVATGKTNEEIKKIM